jgi:hypothetical protein
MDLSYYESFGAWMLMFVEGLSWMLEKVTSWSYVKQKLYKLTIPFIIPGSRIRIIEREVREGWLIMMMITSLKLI